MDEPPTNVAPSDAGENAPTSEPIPNMPAPSTSVDMDAPTIAVPDRGDSQMNATDDKTSGLSSLDTPPASTDPPAVPTQVEQNAGPAATSGTLGWGAARENITQGIATSGLPAGQVLPDSTPAKRGLRGGKRASFANGGPTPRKASGDGSQATPGSSGRGRGRGGGRPRGSRARGGGRGGKRKREEGSDGESDDSEVYTSHATMTKSGRSIQKPTTFVPPPPSPTTTTTKRKRTYRRNPESAVCKMCLRGTSPATNMIVFCDGCNTPYHRYCHQPPIDQAVIDQIDAEWYCKSCERERIVPVPEAEVSHFVAVEGASTEQRQKYFASLAPGLLVTLLTRATTLKPDLPVFGPDFEARPGTSAGALPQAVPTNGNAQAMPSQAAPASTPLASSRSAMRPLQTFPKPTTSAPLAYAEQDSRYPVPDEHPAHYVRPGEGLMNNLPPEREDLQWLVDDEDRHGVFSHYVLNPQNPRAGPMAELSQAGPGA